MNKNIVIKKKLQQCHSENNIKKVEIIYLSSNFIYYTKRSNIPNKPTSFLNDNKI